MEIQYLSDEQGRHTAVQIPIDEWNKLTEENEVLRNFEKKKKKPSDFFGTLNIEEGEKMQKYLMESRNEKKPSVFRGSISKSTAEQLLKYVEQTRWK